MSAARKIHTLTFHLTGLAGEDEATQGADNGTHDDGRDDGSDHVTLLLAASEATGWSARRADNTCDEINVSPLGAGVVDVAGVVSMYIRRKTKAARDRGPRRRLSVSGGCR